MNVTTKRSIILVSFVVVVALIISIGFLFFLHFTDKPKKESSTFKLTTSEKNNVKETISDFIETSGNYGIKKQDFEPYFLERFNVNRENIPQKSFVSRSKSFNETVNNFLSKNSEIKKVRTFAGLKNPFSIKTKIKDMSISPSGFLDTDDKKNIKIEVSLFSKMTYMAQTQGYLDKNGKPIKPVAYKYTDTWTDTGTIQLVKENGKWRVFSADNFTKIRLLSFQDKFLWADDILVDLPNPDSSNKVKVSSL